MRVISVTPAGRRRYLAALVPHLLRQRHIIDEHHWWLNTTDEADARYVKRVSAEHPGFFKICCKETIPNLTIGRNIWRFFREYSEPDTLYVRLDDDIVWFAHDAIENLVRYRLAHREPVVVLGNVVNNAVCTHALQQHGIVPSAWGEVENFGLDGNGWACPEFARKLHGLFLSDLENGRIERWKEVAIHIHGARRFSVNVISWLGDDMRRVPEVAEGCVDEELFLTVTVPRRLGRANAACGDALFTHFAFYTQRPYLEWTWPELIGHYRRIAEERPSQQSFHERARKLIRHAAWRSGKHVRKYRAFVQKREKRAEAEQLGERVVEIERELQALRSTEELPEKTQRRRELWAELNEVLKQMRGYGLAANVVKSKLQWPRPREEQIRLSALCEEIRQQRFPLRGLEKEVAEWDQRATLGDLPDEDGARLARDTLAERLSIRRELVGRLATEHRELRRRCENPQGRRRAYDYDELVPPAARLL